MPKDGRPKVTPQLDAPKSWIMNYEIRINGTTIRDTIMVPRGVSRSAAREALAQNMSFALAKIITEMFGD
jgi:hypothetical protein